MEKYFGKSAYNGVAMGKILFFRQGNVQIKKQSVVDTQTEKNRLREALVLAISELEELCEIALEQVGKENAKIFEAYQVMLEDEEYKSSIEKIIDTQAVNAEYAVWESGNNYINMFEKMDDDYLRARAADMKDITDRVINTLGGKKKEAIVFSEPSIIVAEDLVPSQTVQIDRKNVVAIVTKKGSANSHTAILAKTMGIPALVGTDICLDNSLNGRYGIVDSYSGALYVEPDAITTEKMKKRIAEEIKRKELLHQLKGKDDVTQDGRNVRLYANISNVADLDSVIENDASGIGLFRSEFIYLERDAFPTEEEQVEIYSAVAKTMAGKPVIIRTLDIGADKQCDYFEMEKEDNPALGVRAIRICLTRPDIFKTQLRALFRASVSGNISIMYPMITSVWEVERIKEIEEEVKKELYMEGIEFGNPSIGVMVETPAAVMEARELAKLVDFLSIGTNDLTQYTLALDRQNPNLDEFYHSHHPAIIKMIQMVIEGAHAEGKWVGICGELAADIELTRELIMMGIDELSVAPSKVLPIRKIIRETT